MGRIIGVHRKLENPAYSWFKAYLKDNKIIYVKGIVNKHSDVDNIMLTSMDT